MISSKNNQLILLAILLLSNKLLIASQKTKRLKPSIPVITRDMAINIGKFLPGNNQFLNQLVRLYPAEEVTYKNIAQKLIEQKLVIESDENISRLLDKYFKTSRVKTLQFNLKQNIEKLKLDNYLLLVKKQKNYIQALFYNPKSYFESRKELIYANSYMLKNIQQAIIQSQNLSKKTKAKLVYYKKIYAELNKNLNNLAHFDNQNETYLIAFIMICCVIKGILLYPIVYLLLPNIDNSSLTRILLIPCSFTLFHFLRLIKDYKLKLKKETQVLINKTNYLESIIERKITNLDNN